jgi:hypothetical protein
MTQTRISERKAPRAGERALARLPQTRHHPDIAGERGGIAKAARVAQLGDQACGSPCAYLVNRCKKSANFVTLKLALDFLVELLNAIPQELNVRTRVFDLQLVSLGVMTTH